MARKTKKTRKLIRESLIKQLEDKGANVAHFESLVEDYMSYYDAKEEMLTAIAEKGITYMAISSTGKEYEKDNPAVKLLPQYTRQMLSILKDLGLTTDNVIMESDDESDYI